MSERPDSADGGPQAGAWLPPVQHPTGAPAPGYGPPAQGGSELPPQQPSTWTAPAQPGLVPLRPMTLGTLLSGSFSTLRRNPRPLLGIALGAMIVTLLLTGLVFVFAMVTVVARLETVSAENVEEVTAGSILGLILAQFVPGLVSVVLVAMLQGIVVVEVARAVLGEKLTLRQLWARARGRFWALIGWTAAIFVALIVFLALVAGLIVLLVTTLGAVGIALGVLIGIVSALAVLALAIWLGTKLSLVPSALMVERLRLRAALRRSWSLTNGYFWRTFGVQALVATIVNVALQVVMTPFSFLIPMVGLIIDPNGTNEGSALIVMGGLYVVFLALTVALSAAVMIVQSAANGLIYIDLRMRKEGLELDLARYTEQRDAGVTDPSDPYRANAGDAVGPMPPAASGSPWQ